MCGLAGIVAAGPAASSRSLVQGMLRALAHRGPDGEGLLERDWVDTGASVILGHRRLSILDLSAAAAQPMSSADGRIHVILNGEILNYVELRGELRAKGVRFRSASDTEVLLESWRAWGVDVLPRLEGMFAFAILDEDRRELVLARDAFGIKPLYYAHPDGALAFASEIPPLLALPGVSRRAAAAPLGEFLDQGVNTLAGTTLFADVHELPAAHLARVALVAPLDVRPEAYWRPPRREREPLSFRDATAQLRERLEERVRRHLRSDVPVGFFVSGGMDSSSLLAMARRVRGSGEPLHVFSYRAGAGAVDEGAYQAAACAAAGATSHDVRVTPEEWARDLEALIVSQGEPFASPVVYAQRRLFQAAAEQGIKVVLEGQGADECLAGYGRHHSARVASLFRQGRLVRAAQMIRARARAEGGWRSTVRESAGYAWPGLRAIASGARRLPGLASAAWLASRGADRLPAWRAEGREVLRELLSRDVHAPSIPWLMRYADRNAMAFSIENRVPFLDLPLTDWVLGLPEAHYVADNGTGKTLLRAAMRGFVPDVIIDRTERVGFDVPIEAWVACTPGLRDLVAQGAALPPVHAGAAQRLLARVESGARLTRAQAFGAWRLATLAAWQRTFGVTFD